MRRPPLVRGTAQGDGWRGGAAIFLAWERAADGSRAGLRYWSTQRSTDGIGERVERFGPGPGELRR
ncbi:MAG: hypothetical protein ACKOSS_05610, partial [Planctomycetia bacterium]